VDTIFSGLALTRSHRVNTQTRGFGELCLPP